MTQDTPTPEAPDTAAAAPEAATDLVAELEAARLKAAENFDLYVRARAEMDNVRRRAEEDVAKAHKYGIESFAEALLPVADSLDKALEASSGQIGPMRDGLELTARQLAEALRTGGLKEINPLGERFDPHTQQAIAVVPAPAGVAGGHVVAVLQKGWIIADRVLRPALVTVAQG